MCSRRRVLAGVDDGDCNFAHWPDPAWIDVVVVAELLLGFGSATDDETEAATVSWDDPPGRTAIATVALAPDCRVPRLHVARLALTLHLRPDAETIAAPDGTVTVNDVPLALLGPAFRTETE